jgi:hypothetical protein
LSHSDCCKHFTPILPLTALSSAPRLPGAIREIASEKEAARTQLRGVYRVSLYVDAKLISGNESSLLASLARPENFLAALFPLSITLWLIAFVAFFVILSFSSLVASIFQAVQFSPAPRLVTLFPDGSSTSRPTLPR